MEQTRCNLSKQQAKSGQFTDSHYYLLLVVLVVFIYISQFTFSGFKIVLKVRKKAHLSVKYIKPYNTTTNPTTPAFTCRLWLYVSPEVRAKITHNGDLGQKWAMGPSWDLQPTF